MGKIDSPEGRNDMTRRHFLELAASRGVLAAVFGYLAGCKEKKEVPQEPAPQLSSEPPIEPACEKMTTTMPSVRFLDEKMEYPKPNGINVSQEEYLQLAKEFTYEVETYFIPKLIRSFEQFPHLKAPNAPREELIVHFLLASVEAAARRPEFRPYIDQKKDERDMTVWADHIKPLFMAGGSYFDFNRNLGIYNPDTGKITPSTQLLMYRIDSNEMVEMKDDKGAIKVPVLHIGDRLFDLDEFSSPGLYDPQSEIAMIFDNNLDIKSGIDELIKSGVIKERPKNEAKVIEHYNKNAVIHEATHVLIGKRHEQGRTTDINQMYQVPFSVPYVNKAGMAADVSGVYAPVHFTELCAVGNEIYHDQSDFPLTYVMYFSDDKNFAYEFVRKALPVFTLKAMPESPEKDALIARLQTGQKMSSVEIARIATHKLSHEARKEVGAALFHMGQECYRMAQNGELQGTSFNFQ